MLKILLVEDEADDFQLVRDYMRDISGEVGQPIFVEQAASVEAAELHLKFEFYDLYLVDYHLKGHNGLAFIERAKKAGVRAPIVLMSGHESIQMPVHAMDWVSRGEISFMPKSDLNPVNLKRLIEGVLGISKQVLLVDDDIEDFHLTKAYLELSPFYRFDLVWASSLEEAWRQVSEREFDIILVDYRLGTENGMDFVRDMARRGLGKPMVLLSGEDSVDADETMVRLMGRRQLGFLSKRRMNTDSLTQVLVQGLH